MFVRYYTNKAQHISIPAPQICKTIRLTLQFFRLTIIITIPYSSVSQSVFSGTTLKKKLIYNGNISIYYMAVKHYYYLIYTNTILFLLVIVC